MHDWDITRARRATQARVPPGRRERRGVPQWIETSRVVRRVRDSRGEIDRLRRLVGERLTTRSRGIPDLVPLQRLMARQYGEGHYPGPHYRRDRARVAVRITQPDDALAEEARPDRATPSARQPARPAAELENAPSDHQRKRTTMTTSNHLGPHGAVWPLPSSKVATDRDRTQ